MAKKVDDARPILLLGWRMQAHETGLRRAGELPRGYDLCATGRMMAHVRPLMREHVVTGWGCTARDDARGVPELHTSGESESTPETAMAQAEQHILKYLSTTFRVLLRRPRGMGKPATLEANAHG